MNPFGYAIFCDEIRQEVSGKLILIGVYTGTLMSKVATPFVMPRLGILISWLEPANIETAPLAFELYLPQDVDGEPTAMQELVPVGTPQSSEVDRSELLDPDLPRRKLVQVMGLDSALILQEGAIRLVVRRGDERMRIGVLQVRVAPDAVPSNIEVGPAIDEKAD